MVAAWVPIDLDYVDHEPPPDIDVGLLTTLLDAIEAHRPAWQADALCREHPEVNFFPGRGESLEPAKAICARCPCDLECARYSSETEANAGVWAGVSVARRGKGLTPVKE